MVERIWPLTQSAPPPIPIVCADLLCEIRNQHVLGYRILAVASTMRHSFAPPVTNLHHTSIPWAPPPSSNRFCVFHKASYNLLGELRHRQLSALEVFECEVGIDESHPHYGLENSDPPRMSRPNPLQFKFVLSILIVYVDGVGRLKILLHQKRLWNVHAYAHHFATVIQYMTVPLANNAIYDGPARK